MKIQPGYMQHLVEDMQLAHVKDSKLSMFSILKKYSGHIFMVSSLHEPGIVIIIVSCIFFVFRSAFVMQCMHNLKVLYIIIIIIMHVGYWLLY